VLGQIAAARAVQPAQPALDHASHAASIQVPPALDAMVLDLQAASPAARTDRLFATQRDGHDHRLLAELHIAYPGTRKPEHPVECGGDPHVALLRRPLNIRHPAACRTGAAAGRPACGQLARLLQRAPKREAVANPRAARQAAATVSPAPRQTAWLQALRPLDPGFGPAIWQ